MYWNLCEELIIKLSYILLHDLNQLYDKEKEVEL